MAKKDLTEEMGSILQRTIVPIAVLVFLGVAGGVGYHFYNKNQQQKTEKAADELFVLQKELSEAAQKLNPQPPASEDPKKAPKVMPKPTAQQMEQSYSPIVAKLQAFVKANQGLQPAVEGALLVSEVSSDYLKYDEGITALQAATKDFNKKNFLFGVAKSELGTLYAQTDKCNEAVQAWESVIDVKEHDYMADQLRVKSGVCYQKLGMYDKAEKLFQEVLKKGAQSSNGRLAKKFLLYIKYEKSKAADAKVSEQKNG